MWGWWDGWGLVKKALALARSLLLYPEAPALTALHDDKGIVCMERRTAEKILEILKGRLEVGRRGSLDLRHVFPPRHSLPPLGEGGEDLHLGFF